MSKIILTIITGLAIYTVLLGLGGNIELPVLAYTLAAGWTAGTITAFLYS